ncbi:MAG: ABC transporter ATP-binding protein [Armatimonadota bacterium]
MSTLLEAGSVCKAFGGLVAVSDASFTVQSGQITALIGPNGAGKTTMLNMISGVFPPSSGWIHLLGKPIHHLPPHKIAARGIARTFQNVELFTNMTVLENVMVGRHLRSRGNLFTAATRLGGTNREERKTANDALTYLEMVGLADVAHEDAGDLPFGRQRLLEIARALATEPSLLLLDEAASGLSTREKKELVELIYRIRKSGVTIFLVDHDMDLVMDISDHVVVLDHGEKIAEGTPAEVQRNERVIAAYLGEEPVEGGSQLSVEGNAK